MCAIILSHSTIKVNEFFSKSFLNYFYRSGFLFSSLFFFDFGPGLQSRRRWVYRISDSCEIQRSTGRRALRGMVKLKFIFQNIMLDSIFKRVERIFRITLSEWCSQRFSSNYFFFRV